VGHDKPLTATATGEETIMRITRWLHVPVLAAVAAGMAACEREPLSSWNGELAATAFHERAFQQVDRFGLPAINTVFIPSAKKDLFNRSIPSDDRAQFLNDVFGFGNDAAYSEALALLLMPDVQPFDRAIPAGFPNGRRLTDDVITTELGLIFRDNAALNDDHVDANDVPFLPSFPYLAHPHFLP
jgi:hypothetical protein